MDERQVRNPNTTYNGCKMEFWKFALTWRLICPIQHKMIQKRAKETNKEGGISSTIMDQKSIYNSTHKPHRSLNERLGFNQDDHLHRMCNETGIPESLELQILGIPLVVMVTSHARSLCDPTQQNFIHAHNLPIYIYVSHVIQILKNPPEYTMRNRVQSGRNTKNDTHAHLLGIT